MSWMSGWDWCVNYCPPSKLRTTDFHHFFSTSFLGLTDPVRGNRPFKECQPLRADRAFQPQGENCFLSELESWKILLSFLCSRAVELRLALFSLTLIFVFVSILFQVGWESRFILWIKPGETGKIHSHFCGFSLDRCGLRFSFFL